MAIWARRRKRALTEHDTRPDWRDPNMKVYDVVLFSDGIERPCMLPPELAHQFAVARFDDKNVIPPPHWTKDPTYDLRRRRAQS